MLETVQQLVMNEPDLMRVLLRERSVSLANTQSAMANDGELKRRSVKGN